MPTGHKITRAEKEHLTKRYRELEKLGLSHYHICERLGINQFTMKSILRRMPK